MSLRWVVDAGTVSSQKVVAVLKSSMESRTELNLLTLFAARHQSILRKAGAGQAGQALRTSRTVKTGAAGYARVAQFFTLFLEQSAPSVYLKESRCCKSF